METNKIVNKKIIIWSVLFILVIVTLDYIFISQKQLILDNEGGYRENIEIACSSEYLNFLSGYIQETESKLDQYSNDLTADFGSNWMLTMIDEEKENSLFYTFYDYAWTVQLKAVAHQRECMTIYSEMLNSLN